MTRDKPLTSDCWVRGEAETSEQRKPDECDVDLLECSDRAGTAAQFHGIQFGIH